MRLSTIMFSIVVSRILTPADFGLAAMAIVGVILLNIFSGFGLGPAIVREPEITQTQLSTAFFVQLGGNLILFLLAIPLAFVLDDFYGEPRITHLFLLLTPLFIINGLTPVQQALFGREMDYKIITYRTLFAETVAAAVAIAAALMGAGIYSLITHSLMAASLNAAFTWRVSKWRPTWEFNWASLSNMWQFGTRFYFNQMIQSVFGQSRPLIFGRIFGTEILGHFNRANNLNVTVNQLASGTYMSLAFSALSRLNTDREAFLDAMNRGLKMKGAIMVSAIGVFFIAGDALILLMYGPQWVYAASLFPLLTISGMLGYLSSFLRSSMESLGRSDLTLRMQLIFSSIVAISYGVAYFYGIEMMLYFLLGASALKLLLSFQFASSAFQLPMGAMLAESTRLWFVPVLVMVGARLAVVSDFINPWIASGIYGLFLIFYFRGFYRDSVWNEVMGLYEVYREKIQRMYRKSRSANPSE